MIGLAIFYLAAGYVLEYFGISTDIPIREMDSMLVTIVFALLIMGFALTLTICAVAISFAYFSMYCIGGSLSIKQVKSITLCGRYPQHWYRKDI